MDLISSSKQCITIKAREKNTKCTISYVDRLHIVCDRRSLWVELESKSICGLWIVMGDLIPSLIFHREYMELK